MTTSAAARGVSIEAIQRVPLFADLNKYEIQEIARLFKEHRFAEGKQSFRRARPVTPSS